MWAIHHGEYGRGHGRDDEDNFQTNGNKKNPRDYHRNHRLKFRQFGTFNSDGII